MKTTVEITDTLLEEVKKVAVEEHTTVRALIEEGLRRVVGERRQRPAFRLRRASFGGQGLHADVQEGSWQQIRALAYRTRDVIAVDTNLLVYAHREDSPWHAVAYHRLVQ